MAVDARRLAQRACQYASMQCMHCPKCRMSAADVPRQSTRLRILPWMASAGVRQFQGASAAAEALDEATMPGLRCIAVRMQLKCKRKMLVSVARGLSDH